jgi:hypothetical protein
MSDPPTDHVDDPNDGWKLTTEIDGEEVRLLVHIEPLGDDGSRPTPADGGGEERPSGGAD